MEQQSDFEQAEQILEKSLQAAAVAGLALKAIKEKRYYEIKYATFGVYCEDRWGISRTTAYRMIDASLAVCSIAEEAARGLNVAQVLALAKIPKDKQVEVIEKIKDSSGKVTTEKIRGAALEFEIDDEDDCEDGSAMNLAPEVDLLGNPLPEWLVPAFDLIIELKEQIEEINHVIKWVENMQDVEAMGVFWLHSQTLLADLRNAKAAIKFSMPHAVCPQCKAQHEGQECGACKGSGFVSKNLYETLTAATKIQEN